MEYNGLAETINKYNSLLGCQQKERQKLESLNKDINCLMDSLTNLKEMLQEYNSSL